MIFVVEDDPNIRELVTYTLQSTGFDACGFENGSEFLKALSDGEKPELVLLDIMLPGEDGISILGKLRKKSATKDLPIITTVRIPRKQSGQLRDAHAHVGRLDRALLQQRIARVLRRPLRDRSDRHPQRIAPPAGHRHTAGHRIGNVRRSRPRHRQTIQALGAATQGVAVATVGQSPICGMRKICGKSAKYQQNVSGTN